MQPNFCKAKCCNQPIMPELLLCANHWDMLPEYYKKKISEHYTPGQHLNKKLITKQYYRYAIKARNIVSYKERIAKGGLQ